MTDTTEKTIDYFKFIVYNIQVYYAQSGSDTRLRYAIYAKNIPERLASKNQQSVIAPRGDTKARREKRSSFMSKKLLAIVTVIVCVLMAFTACSAGKEPLTEDNGKNVSVGGFVAETDDYVYFINGNELYTEDNTLNKVEKGALVRVKKTELEKGKDAKTECVVSKLVSTGDYSAGIAVANGRIYFATPSAEKDKIGNIKNTEIEFYSAKLDGTDLKKIATSNGADGNTSAYRFHYTDNKMFVTFLSQETVTEDGSEVTKKYLNVYGDDGKEVFKAEYESYIFDKNDGNYLYYTASVKNDTLNSTESFNAVYRNKIGNEDAELMLYGAGSNRNTSDKTYANKGIQGVKFTLLAAQNGYLYLSAASVDTTPSTNTFYAFIGEEIKTDAEANYADMKNSNVMTSDGANAPAALASTSLFFAPDNIMYLDSSLGFCAYNYTKRMNYADNYGVTVEYTDKDLLSGSIAYVANNYLYCQVSGVYYRIALTDNKIASDAKTEKISALTYSTSWYAPETVKVGEKEFVLGMFSSSDYKDYVFATEIEDFEANLLNEDKTAVSDENIEAFVKGFLTKEKVLASFYEDNKETKLGAFLSGNNRTSVNYMWTKVVSLIGTKAQKEIDKYLKDTYPESSSSSSSSDSSDSCSSAITCSAIIAAVVMGGFAVAVSKKRG